jgi:hypothetical protein
MTGMVYDPFHAHRSIIARDEMRTRCRAACIEADAATLRGGRPKGGGAKVP